MCVYFKLFYIVFWKFSTFILVLYVLSVINKEERKKEGKKNNMFYYPVRTFYAERCPHFNFCFVSEG
jgi:hypothetical protein